MYRYLDIALAGAKRVLGAALFLAGILFAAMAFAEPPDALGAGDSVRVTVLQNPDLTTETRVSERGTILFPLIGEVRVAGLTPEEVAARIAARLRGGKLVLEPQVSVRVLEVRSRLVSVLGQVARPGLYPLDGADTRLTDVLALAGGVTSDGADTVTVVATRDGRTRHIEVNLPAMYRSGNLSRDLRVHRGDSIYVPRASVFYIYGEVQHPGAYRLAPGMTVMQALSAGGGLTLRDTERGLRIERAAADGNPRTIDAHLGTRVEPNDVIRVAESWF